MEFAGVMLRGGKIPPLSSELPIPHLRGEPWGGAVGGCPVLSPRCLGRVSGEGVGDEGRMWCLRKCGQAELSERAQANTVVSSALQRPFGASDHKAGASLKGLGLVLAPLGPPAEP